MSGEKSSADWIPAGWTVEVKFRKDGRQDKYYVDPSKGLKFNSKPEVFRYLNNIEINNSKTCGKQKGIVTRSAINCVDDKVEAEVLPPTGIRETRFRENSRRIKKDLEASRNHDKGELGSLASISKNKDRSTMGLDDDKISSPTVAEERKLPENVANIQNIPSQSSKLARVVKDEQNLGSTGSGGCMPVTKDSSAQCMEQAASSSANVPEDKDLEPKEGESDSTTRVEQKEEESDSTTRVRVSTHVVGDLPETLPSENGTKRHGSRKAQNDLPRRASKRLAGIKVNDPATELNYYYNAQSRVTPKKSTEAKASTDERSGNSNPPQERSGRSEAENEADKKSEDAPVVPPENLSIPDENLKGTEIEEKPTDLSFRDLWSDPCIEFAIKTLTGAIPLEDKIKAEESPNPLQDLTFGDSWTDPCIEFAIKTLTGEIPVGEDLSIHDYFQRQSSSSENRGDKGLTFPNGTLDKAIPTFEQNGNVSLQNSGGDGLRQSEELPRQTIF